MAAAHPSALPTARTPDPMSAPALRWGVIGTGWIAGRFVAALHASTTQRVIAVGSRGAERSATVAAEWGVPRSFGSYEELVADPEIDVIYVATEHPAHLPCARLALLAGKPVLVEKPIGINAAEARELATLAAERGLFCMEALWSFFLPKFDVIRQILDSGMLGEISVLMVDNGEELTGHRRVMSPEMAGGPMLDLGTYPFAFAHAVLGEQRLVAASGQHHPAGVNVQLSAILTDDADRQTVIHTTVLTNTPVRAFVAGSAATLVLDGPFYQPGGFEVRFADGGTLRYDEPAVGQEALFWQAAEVARRITAGDRESPLRPLAASIATLEAMDAVRGALGIRFPTE